MRRLVVLCFCFLALATAPPPATVETLAPDAEARWVPFVLTPANQIRFTAMLDGRPIAAILDTGVSYSVVSRRRMAEEKLHVRPGAAAVAIGGAVASGWADLPALEVGALARRSGRITVADLPLAATGGAAVDLLVGRDVTAGYALDLDYDAQRFRLLPSGRMPFRGSIAPLRIAGTWPSYVTELEIGGRRLDRVMVDTGDGTALTVSHATWAGVAPPVATTSTLAYGIGGAAIVDLAVLPQVRSGERVARDVETRIEPTGGYSDAIGMRARIGSGFLAGYRVLLDPGAGRMVLLPGRHAERAPVRSTSGLLLRVEPDRLLVLHVMRGGPGEAAGWRSGEAICTVDGAAVNDRMPLGWTVGTPGRTLRLGTCGGGVRALTLRVFY